MNMSMYKWCRCLQNSINVANKMATFEFQTGGSNHCLVEESVILVFQLFSGVHSESE